jgi:uncharacterized damage-inducible protein DinB
MYQIRTSWLANQVRKCLFVLDLFRLSCLAYNNAWSNYRVLSACAKLTQGEFEAERTGFFPSLQGH